MSSGLGPNDLALIIGGGLGILLILGGLAYVFLRILKETARQYEEEEEEKAPPDNCFFECYKSCCWSRRKRATYERRKLRRVSYVEQGYRGAKRRQSIARMNSKNSQLSQLSSAHPGEKRPDLQVNVQGPPASAPGKKRNTFADYGDNQPVYQTNTHAPPSHRKSGTLKGKARKKHNTLQKKQLQQYKKQMQREESERARQEQERQYQQQQQQQQQYQQQHYQQQQYYQRPPMRQQRSQTYYDSYQQAAPRRHGTMHAPPRRQNSSMYNGPPPRRQGHGPRKNGTLKGKARKKHNTMKKRRGTGVNMNLSQLKDQYNETSQLSIYEQQQLPSNYATEMNSNYSEQYHIPAYNANTSAGMDKPPGL